MIYVIQTVVGQEEKVCSEINLKISKEHFTKCYIPKRENIWKSHGKSNVSVDVLFPGYIFIFTDNSERVYENIKKLNIYALLINALGEKEKHFIPLGIKEQELIGNILDDEGILRISYVCKGADGSIEKVTGPLKDYVSNIVKTDYKNRRTFIEIMMFGKKKRIKFCIELDGDIVCR